jgi:hypothetical protein
MLSYMKQLFLIAATLVTIGSVIPYIRDIFNGSTKPNIVSWMTWTILTSIATIAELADHQYITAIFTTSAVIATFLIVILGLKYGYAKYTQFDAICQVGSLLGFVLWWLLNSPAAAVIAVVCIDFIGALPTIRHAYIAPYEETWTTFALAGLGGALAILALSQYSWTSLTYAVYIVVINIIFSGLILIRMKSVPHAA